MGSREDWVGLVWVLGSGFLPLCFFKAGPCLEPGIHSKNTPIVGDIRGLLEPGFMLLSRFVSCGSSVHSCYVSLAWSLHFPPKEHLFLLLCLLPGTFPSLSTSLTWFQSHLLCEAFLD